MNIQIHTSDESYFDILENAASAAFHFYLLKGLLCGGYIPLVSEGSPVTMTVTPKRSVPYLKLRAADTLFNVAQHPYIHYNATGSRQRLCERCSSLEIRQIT